MNPTTTSAPPQHPAFVTAFGYSPLAPALWGAHKVPGLEHRDLSLAQASGQVLRGLHLRTAGVPVTTPGLIDTGAALAFVFVLAGRVSLRSAGAAPIELHALDSACRYGDGSADSWTLSHDAQVVLVAATSTGRATLGLDAATPGSWFISRDDESAYVLGEGPRKYFGYRDLGVTQATQRRIHIHIVRATAPRDGGTGWHSHSMGQLFYVLRGFADLRVEHRPAVRMTPGDAMCLAPRLRHDVPAFSADYLVLEMCVPADYDTVEAVAPDA